MGIQFPQITSQKPVSVRWLAGEAVSTGLAWEDYSRSHRMQHLLAPGRWYATPAWTLSDDRVSEVVVSMIERRALIFKPDPNLTPQERLLCAQKKLRILTERKREIVAEMKRTLSQLSWQRPEDQPRISQLRREICTYMTDVRIADTSPAKIAAVIYLYFRTGFDARSVAIDIGLMHSHVRQLITRIRDRAEELGYESRILTDRSPHPSARRTLSKPERQPHYRENVVPGLGKIEVLEQTGDMVRIRALGREMMVHRLRLEN